MVADGHAGRWAAPDEISILVGYRPRNQDRHGFKLDLTRSGWINVVPAPKRNSLIDGQMIWIAFPFAGFRSELVDDEALAVLGRAQ